MLLYNTLTREKETFKPINGNTAGMYSCGPTVYNYAHIGNLRSYLFMDWLRRALRFSGYNVTTVMNITDVGHLVSDEDEGEDKMQKAAREQSKSPWDIAKEYTEIFMRDIALLNISVPEVVPKATEHIPEMIEFVQDLCEKGYGYETSDGIYFDISKFLGYGKLSHLNLDEQLAGARVEVNNEKRHPADFALWKKAAPEHIMQWASPWGQGYPGWHIECSVMSRKYLGDLFDIHTGGVDHIPIHHENEIAQSEAYLGHKAVNTWMHGEFLLVNGGKMSKSLGTNYLLSDLTEKGFSPMHYRFFCASAHYRNKLNFTWEAMEAAKVSYNRLHALVHTHKGACGAVGEDELAAFSGAFRSAVEDDVNIPKALGVLWNAARNPVKNDKIFKMILQFDEVFGFSLEASPAAEETPEYSPEVSALIAKRDAARKSKDYAEADRIRALLKEMNITIADK